MLRTLLAVFAGAVVGVVVIFIVEGIGHMIFPPPEGVDVKDPEQLKSVMDKVPVAAKAAVLVAWGLGVFAGGTLARFIVRDSPYVAWIVAVILFAGATWTMIMIPHPLWMVLGSILATLMGVFAAHAASPARPPN